MNKKQRGWVHSIVREFEEGEMDISLDPALLYCTSASDNVIDLSQENYTASVQSAEYWIDEYLLHQEIMATVDALPIREKEVIYMRYGLTGFRPLTRREVGNILDISYERVRQIEVKALCRLRHPNNSRRLKDALYR